MKTIRKHGLALTTTLALSLATTGAWAQPEEQKKDKTGTNPINFATDFRIYNEYIQLNADGDANQNLTTVEFRAPLLEGKWQYRVRARYAMLDIDDAGIDEKGIGDIDMRFLTVLSLNKESKTAWAAGMEFFLDTASEDELGSGTNSIGPQVFWVKFLKNGLFAPGMQYKTSWVEDAGREETDQVLIDLNYLRMADNKLSWFFTDPQIVIDNENDIEFAIVDFEFGWMMVKWFPEAKGQSFYVRPSIGVGTDRATDGAIEVGYKWIGW
jgi:hypothetical protein